MSEWVESIFGSELSLAQVGGKALNVSKLVQARFRVPAGFVVTTSAYRHFLAANRLDSILELLWSRLTDDPQIYAMASSQLQDLFDKASIPTDLRRQLLKRYRKLASEVAVMVRVSSTVKDVIAGTEAGHTDSFPNVFGEQAMLSAIHRCWASLWTKQSIAYLHQNGIQPLDAAMGVLVQSMVPVNMSGSLFTIDPIMQEENHVLINAVWGMSMGLTSGRRTPDLFIVEKSTGDLVDQRVADKSTQLTLQNGFMQEEAVTRAQRRQFCLKEIHISALAKAARQLETLFGEPQDVEWGILGGNLYIFQSRPIRSSPQPAVTHFLDDKFLDDKENVCSDQPDDLWTQYLVGDLLPQATTPLTASVWKPLLEETFADLLNPLLDKQHRPDQWLRQINGRFYLNEGVFARHLNVDPYELVAKSKPAPTNRSESILQTELKQMERTYQPGFLLEKILGDEPKTRTWEQASQSLEELPQDVQRLRSLYTQRGSQNGDPPQLPTSLTDPDLFCLFTDHALSDLGQILKGVVGAILMRWTIGQELGKQVGEQKGPQLLTVTARKEQAALSMQLFQLVHQLYVEMTDAFDWTTSAPIPDKVGRELWQRIQTDPAHAALLTQLQTFLEQNGYRTGATSLNSPYVYGTLDWYYPRWQDDPVMLLLDLTRFLQREVNNLDHLTGGNMVQKLTERESAAEHKAEAKLNPIQRILFRRNLTQGQALSEVEQNGRRQLEQLIQPMRAVLLELGRRWVEHGWLSAPTDLFFLHRSEIEQIAQAGDPAKAGLAMDKLIDQRRAAWQFWRAKPGSAPAIDGQMRPVEVLTEIDEMMRGIAASPGWAQGWARATVFLEEAMQCRSDEILVTHSCEPEWLPVLPKVRGIVLEVGGQFSKMSITAQEMGVPMITGVTGALYRIRNGQSIQMDGRTGRVYLGDL